MTTLEKIVHELASVPEALLVEVLNSIQVAKSNASEFEKKLVITRTPGLHQGQIWMSEDFNEPLSIEF
ncbi:hypothetical protein [Chamaesiphon sp. OTE_8_metabat_110]|uniref:hypothetical protein n=1 Tax=Chamaesiphon sp. OTE_8_metabat_110 TaxID=2964696 RepID=UPI00286C57FB|nr:hypothetical protein [Chamaesiphon sp. OTE_8_metabat_110]